MTSDNRFPDGFVWGAATASYQVEGAVDKGGRGKSIWDTFSHTPGRTVNGDTGDVACRHYERLEEDLALIKRLGLKAYRFSVAWPRVQPDGKGPANQAGLDFYRRLVGGLRAQGTMPVATLYHWDLPQTLEDEGGWTARATAERFGEYAAVVAGALADEVGMWITLNEPFCSAWLGYGEGVHAPGFKSPSMAASATHHLLLAHALGTEALRGVTHSPVGITLNLSPMLPASDHELDVAAAREVDGGVNRTYLDPLFKGKYPDDVVERAAKQGVSLEAVRQGDLELINRPVDFLGVNYYSTNVFADARRAREASDAGYRLPPGTLPAGSGASDATTGGILALGRPALERTAMGWEIDPKGMTDLLVRVHEDYTTVPLYITENGAAQHDYRGPDGAVHDPGRVRYLAQHIGAVGDAIDAGVDVKGYFAWSLMDNYEWQFGYSMRFGITWVDYPSGERVPKDSYHWYREVIAANGLPAPT